MVTVNSSGHPPIGRAHSGAAASRPCGSRHKHGESAALRSTGALWRFLRPEASDLALMRAGNSYRRDCWSDLRLFCVPGRRPSIEGGRAV